MVLAFYVAALIGAILVVNYFPTIILLWALFYELSKEFNVKSFDAYSNIILCGVIVIVCLGTSVMPYTGMLSIVRGLDV